MPFHSNTLTRMTGLAMLVLILPAQAAQPDYSGMSDSKLRREIDRSREQVYELYNALNTEDEYDIVCREFRSASSLIRERVCQPNFMTQAYSESASNMMTNRGAQTGAALQGSANNQMVVVPLSQAEITRKNQLLAEKMVQLANENAPLNEAVQKLNQLNAALRERE